MMLDMPPRLPARTTEDRRRRQAQGVAKAKAAGAYRGGPEDTDRNAGIAGMLRSGMSWAQFKRRQAAVARQSPRSPSGPCRQDASARSRPAEGINTGNKAKAAAA